MINVSYAWSFFDLYGKLCDDPSHLMSVASADNRETFRKYVLKPLLDMGFVEMTLKDKPNSMYQRYRLTAEAVKAIRKN